MNKKNESKKDPADMHFRSASTGVLSISQRDHKTLLFVSV